MQASASYLDQSQAPTRDQIDTRPGLLALEFGTQWCGHCQAAAPMLAQVLATRSDVEHLKVEDGKGYALGRSFKVKLWPTIVLLRDGVEVDRLVRPQHQADVTRALAALA